MLAAILDKSPSTFWAFYSNKFIELLFLLIYLLILLISLLNSFWLFVNVAILSVLATTCADILDKSACILEIF
jgi:hypothetical protein